MVAIFLFTAREYRRKPLAAILKIVTKGFDYGYICSVGVATLYLFSVSKAAPLGTGMLRGVAKV